MALNSEIEGHLRTQVVRELEEGGSRATLREPSAKMEVQVVGISYPVTVVRLGSAQGKLDHPRSLKDGSRKKICDYLLLAAVDGEDYAVFVELKKSLASRGDPEEQLIRSRPLLDYLLAVCDVEEGRRTPRPEVCYAIIFEKSKLQKPRLRPDPAGMIDEIPYKTISVRRFVGTEFHFGALIGL